MRRNSNAVYAGSAALSLIFSGMPMTVYAEEPEAVQQNQDNVEEYNELESIVPTAGWSGEITEGSLCYIQDTGEKLIGLQLIIKTRKFHTESYFRNIYYEYL